MIEHVSDPYNPPMNFVRDREKISTVRKIERNGKTKSIRHFIATYWIRMKLITSHKWNRARQSQQNKTWLISGYVVTQFRKKGHIRWFYNWKRNKKKIPKNMTTWSNRFWKLRSKTETPINRTVAFVNCCFVFVSICCDFFLLLNRTQRIRKENDATKPHYMAISLVCFSFHFQFEILFG